MNEDKDLMLKGLKEAEKAGELELLQVKEQFELLKEQKERVERDLAGIRELIRSRSALTNYAPQKYDSKDPKKAEPFFERGGRGWLGEALGTLLSSKEMNTNDIRKHFDSKETANIRTNLNYQFRKGEIGRRMIDSLYHYATVEYYKANGIKDYETYSDGDDHE